jgi:iron complex transport system substrate-binding protein
MRIASLLPAATDIVLALGLGDELVAATFECAIPEARRDDIAVIVGGLDTSQMTPGAIDAYVRSQAGTGDLYTLHDGALRTAAPDLVLTQDLCRVCAVDQGKVDDALRHLGCTADVVTLDPHTLDGILDSIVAVGRAAGALARAERLLDELRARLRAVETEVRGWRRPRVAVIEWIDPVFGGGHWIPDMVEVAGGTAVACHPGARSAPTTWQAVAAERPEVVIVAPCGFGIDGATDQAAVAATQLPGTEVWAIDADALVVRPGPRVVEGVEAIAGVLHPDALHARSDVVRRVQPTSARTDAGTSMPALRSGVSAGGPYDV